MAARSGGAPEQPYYYYKYEITVTKFEKTQTILIKNIKSTRWRSSNVQHKFVILHHIHEVKINKIICSLESGMSKD